MTDQLVIAGRAFKSRLIVGTGKYRSFPEMRRAHEASGADMVTVAVRRVNLTDRSKDREHNRSRVIGIWQQSYESKDRLEERTDGVSRHPVDSIEE